MCGCNSSYFFELWIRISLSSGTGLEYDLHGPVEVAKVMAIKGSVHPVDICLVLSWDSTYKPSKIFCLVLHMP